MALEHPFIVPHVESWVDRGHTINIVYGYCERGDLNSLLNRYHQRKQQIPENNLKLWLCQTLMALDHCNSRSVLHRDIKSGNIFLTSEGNVMIGDFGLATVRQGGDDEDHSLVGTPHFMSPELLAKKPYRSDRTGERDPGDGQEVRPDLRLGFPHIFLTLLPWSAPTAVSSQTSGHSES